MSSIQPSWIQPNSNGSESAVRRFAHHKSYTDGSPDVQDMVDILELAASGLQGTLQAVEPAFSRWDLGEVYTMQHLAVQYNALTMALL